MVYNRGRVCLTQLHCAVYIITIRKLMDHNIERWQAPYSQLTLFCAEDYKQIVVTGSYSKYMCMTLSLSRFLTTIYILLLQILYSRKFSNGANFAYFEHIQIVWKLEPIKSFARDYSNLSRIANFHLLRCSRCPCKYGSRVSSPCMVKEACIMSQKVQITPTCVPGGVA